MWLSQLALVNFRNFAQLRLEPQPGVLVFRGRNGQGKTNLLESVYVLATTRSPRTSVDRELLSWRTPDDADLAAVVAPFARLEARVRRPEGEMHLELSLEGERPGVEGGGVGTVSRAIKLNGLPIPRPAWSAAYPSSISRPRTSTWPADRPPGADST